MSTPCEIDANKGKSDIDYYKAPPSVKKQPDYKPKKDLFFITIISFATFIFAAYVDLYELMFAWSRKYNWFQVDELIFATMVFFPGLVWFSFRRWKDAKVSLDKSLKYNPSLSQVKQSN